MAVARPLQAGAQGGAWLFYRMTSKAVNLLRPQFVEGSFRFRHRKGLELSKPLSNNDSQNPENKVL